MPHNNRRVPLSLQAVFVASNRGLDVTTPPPGKIATRVFRSIQRQLSRRVSSRHGGLLEPSDDNVCPLEISSKDNVELPAHDLQGISSHSKLEIAKGPVRDIVVKRSSTSSRRSSTTTDSSSQSNTDSKHSNEDNSSASSLTLDFHSKFTPQDYLDAMLKSRGYATQSYFVHESGYCNRATTQQCLSYHPYIIDLVKENKIDELQLLFTAGLSTNPANSHGEGLINLVCRLGQADALKVMIDSGCDVQVSDDYGRTPLHDACWSSKPAFKVVELLLTIDPDLLYMKDVRGALPLAYVQEHDFDAWIHFFKSKRNTLWPLRDTTVKRGPPLLTLQSPNIRPIQNSRIVLPHAFVEMLASGQMDPNEVILLFASTDDEVKNSLNSFNREDGSFGGASFGDDLMDCSVSSSSFSMDDYSASLMKSCNYDDVSMMSGGLNQPDSKNHQSVDNIRRFESQPFPCDVQPIPAIRRSLNNSIASIASLPKVHQKIIEATSCKMPRSVTAESIIVPIISDSCNEDTRDIAMSREIVVLPTEAITVTRKALYCIPENDSGLLFGSC